MTPNWSDELEGLQRRLSELIERSDDGRAGREVTAEALAELAVAIEELRTQNTELLASRADLDSERQHFADLFDTVPDGYLITTTEGVITEANSTACNLLGFHRSELIGRPLARHVATSDQGSFYSFLNRVLRTDGITQLTIDLDIRDHALIPVTLHAVAGSDSQHGEVVRWLLHDRRNELTADKLQASEEQLRALFATADVGIVLCDAASEIVFINRRATELLGLPPGGTTEWLRQVPADERESLMEQIASALTGRRSASIRHRVLHTDERDGGKNGNRESGDSSLSVRWIDHHVIPFSSPGESSNGFMSTLIDVTHEQRALARLRQSNDFSNAILESTNAIVIVADSEGRIEVFNRMAEQVSGWTRDEIIGQYITAQLVLRDEGADRRRIAADLASGQVVRWEDTWATKDGRQRRIAWAAAQLPSADGTASSIVGTGIDITEQRLLERQVAQTERLHSIGRLAAGVAHDFNNALAILLARVDRIDRRTTDPDTLSDIDGLRRTIDRSKAMIGNLLTFSGRQPQPTSNTIVGLELTRIVDMLTDLVGEAISIELQAAAGDTEVSIGPERLDQIVTNLAINARDAMPEGGVITIAADLERVDTSSSHASPEGVVLKPGDYARISVTDTGGGIAPETLPHIFEPYFTTKERDRGTGIGLATVYGIIKQAGGSITVESAGGSGTQFTFWLPCVPATDRTGSADRSPGLASLDEAPRRPTILVVEDEDEVRQLLIEELSDEGFATISAARGDIALTMLDEPFDLLLSDIDLPGATGLVVTQALFERWPDRPALLISGVASDETLRRLPESASFLAKPFSRARLLQTIRQRLADVAQGPA